jgi:hypothetical protein
MVIQPALAEKYGSAKALWMSKICNNGDKSVDNSQRRTWIPRDGGPCGCGGSCHAARAALQYPPVPLVDPCEESLNIADLEQIVEYSKGCSSSYRAAAEE